MAGGAAGAAGGRTEAAAVGFLFFRAGLGTAVEEDDPARSTLVFAFLTGGAVGLAVVAAGVAEAAVAMVEVGRSDTPPLDESDDRSLSFSSSVSFRRFLSRRGSLATVGGGCFGGALTGERTAGGDGGT